MTKNEFVAAVAEKTAMSKEMSDKAVKAVLETITETLAKGEKIQFIGFGTFEVRERGEHAGFNPQTKEPITVGVTKSPAFKPGAVLKNAVK